MKKVKFAAQIFLLAAAFPALFISGISYSGKKINDYDLIQKTILNASKEKCIICDRYGASLSCRNESCSSKFHLPCAQSSKLLLQHRIFQSISVFLSPNN